MFIPKAPTDREGALAAKLKKMASQMKKNAAVPKTSSEASTSASTSTSTVEPPVPKKKKAAPRKKVPPKPVPDPNRDPDNFSLFSAAERGVMKIMMSNLYMRKYFMHPSELVAFMELSDGDYRSLAEHAEGRPPVAAAAPRVPNPNPVTPAAVVQPPKASPTAPTNTHPFLRDPVQSRRILQVLRVCIAISRTRSAQRRHK